MKKIEFIAKKQEKLLQSVISCGENISFKTANSLLRKKDIRVNDIKQNQNIDIYAGDKITLFIAENQISKICFYEKVYEDENILIVNKNQGIEVESFVSGVNSLVKEIEKNENYKVFALHRLDRNTKGLVIFAKSKKYLELLKNAMKKGEIRKFYFAEILGAFDETEKNAVAYLLKNEEKSEVKIFDKPLKNTEKITTKISTVNISGGTSQVIVEISNGKTHQIRAHLAYLGHAIIGDEKYGKKENNKKYKQKYQKLIAFKFIFNFSDNNLKYLNDKKIELKINKNLLA